ncbi:MAG: hypothetical protein U9Q66_03175 [Patescibacteria group bacterium]|nr:hypothetical protein [Patescibacteria group bacterium]
MSVTSKNHYSVLEGHKKEIEETIATYQIKLKELKDLRNQLQQIDLDITQKKEIYNQITQQQKKVREYIQSTKTTLKQLKNDIGKDTDKIINSIPTFRFGQNDEELKKIIKQILYKNHKREISAVKDKNEEITQLKKSNQELKENISQIDTKTTQNEDLIKNQYKTITKLENTLKIKKNNIKILEEKLNFNYLEELEKIKQQNDNDKLNQIQKEKDRNKLNSEIDRYKKDTNISYSFPGDL